MTLWLSPRPLLLASKSTARRALLEDAGIAVEIEPADIGERGIEAGAGLHDAAQVALLLATEKAKAVAARHPDGVVLGADQTLALGARRFSKPGDRAAARAQLAVLRGQTHALHSALAVVHNGTVAFEHVASAHLTMRAFSDEFLERYLDVVGDKATASVGAYQVEGAGIQLFDRIEGDHSTILGLPLLPLLHWLRREGLLAA